MSKADKLALPLQLKRAVNDDIVAIAQAGVKGARFAVATRLPYALVLAFIYGRGSLQERVQYVLSSSRKHAVHLATAAALFRTALALLRRTRADCRTNSQLDPLLGGLIAGWLAFGERNFVNEQIILYSAGRLFAVPLQRDKVSVKFPAGKPRPIDPVHFRAFAAAVTGAGLWAAVNCPHRLSPGILQSLQTIYL